MTRKPRRCTCTAIGTFCAAVALAVLWGAGAIAPADEPAEATGAALAPAQPPAAPVPPVAVQEAVVSTEIVSGDPTVPGATFAMGIRVAGNALGPIGTYAFRLLLDSDAVEIEGVADAGEGFREAPNVEQSTPNTAEFSGVCAESKLENGRLCVFYMRTKSVDPLPAYSIGLSPIPPTPLVAMKGLGEGPNQVSFERVPLRIDVQATTNLGVPAGQGPAIVTKVVSEGPIRNGERLSVAVALEGNAEDAIVGTYALKLAYSPDSLELLDMTDGDFGAPPTVAPDGPIVKVSAFNAQSTMANGVLFVANFTVKDAAAERLGVLVQDLPPTPLVGADYKPIPHGFRQETASLGAAR